MLYEVITLDEVLFIPAAIPPHKLELAAPFADHLAMVEAAIADHPHFRVSDLEARRSGKSFSVDTLELLRANDPAGERFFRITSYNVCYTKLLRPSRRYISLRRPTQRRRSFTDWPG